MSNEKIKAYPTYINEGQKRALLINPAADEGLHLKLSAVKKNSHNNLGSIVVDHNNVPIVMFQMMGGNATDADVEEASHLSAAMEAGDVVNIARRAMLALHFILNGTPPAPEAPGTPRPASQGGCQHCHDLDTAHADAKHNGDVLQDPGYDPAALALDDDVIDARIVEEDEPNPTAAMARENAELRQKLLAAQAILSDVVKL